MCQRGAGAPAIPNSPHVVKAVLAMFASRRKPEGRRMAPDTPRPQGLVGKGEDLARPA